MHWYILAFLAPVFWSLSVYTDKFVVSKYVKGNAGTGSLVIFTGLTGFIVSIGILLLGHNPFSYPVASMLGIGLAGAILVASFIPYMRVIQTEDASLVVPLYQLIPVISYVLGYLFLGEMLTGQQLFAGFLIIAGAVSISINFSHKYKINIRMFLLMALSSFAIALNWLLFKIFAVENADGWATGFWEYIGAGIFALLLWLCIKRYRADFNSIVRENGPAVLSLNIGGELLNLSAKLLVGFATISAPLALVALVNASQPLIVFLIGLLLTLWIPKVIEEDITKGFVIQKLASIAVSFVGVYLLLT